MICVLFPHFMSRRLHRERCKLERSSVREFHSHRQGNMRKAGFYFCCSRLGVLFLFEYLCSCIRGSVKVYSLFTSPNFTTLQSQKWNSFSGIWKVHIEKACQLIQTCSSMNDIKLKGELSVIYFVLL